MSKVRYLSEAATLGLPEESPAEECIPPPLPKDVEGYGWLRWLVGTYYDLQDMRIQSGNRMGALKRTIGMTEKQQGAATDWLHLSLNRLEEQLKAATLSEVKRHPLWIEWLHEVRGVGPCIAGTLIAHVSGDHYTRIFTPEDRSWADARKLDLVEREVEVDDKKIKALFAVRHGIAAFESVSHFWSYCGMGLGADGQIQKRKIGQRANWNHALKQCAYKAAESFVRCGDGYRALYDQAKHRYSHMAPENIPLDAPDQRLLGRLLHGDQAENPDGTMLTKALLKSFRKNDVLDLRLRLRPAHIDARARRWTAKIWLAHAWEVWRGIDGLDADPVYAIDVLKHKSRIHVVTR